MTPNIARGEVTAVLDGTPRRLCLTLGALAELEGAFATADLAGRLARPSAADLTTVLAALLRGGGEHAAAEALPRSQVSPAEAARAVAAALEAAAS